jgi:hypothetical protein
VRRDHLCRSAPQLRTGDSGRAAGVDLSFQPCAPPSVQLSAGVAPLQYRAQNSRIRFPRDSVPIAFVAFVAAGVPLYFLLVPRLLRAKDPEMLSFILFFGLSQVIEAVTTIAFGTSERSIPGDQLGGALAAVASLLAGHKVETGPIELLGQTFPAAWVASGIVSGIAVVIVYIYPAGAAHP